MFKKILSICFLLLLIFPIFSTQAMEIEEIKENEVYIFSSPSCPHCQDAKTFLERLKEENLPNLSIKDHDFSQNINQVKDFYQKYNVPTAQQGLIPAIFLKDKYFIGFNSEIEKNIRDYFLNDSVKDDTSSTDEKNEQKIKLPFLGEVDLLNFSLPVLAIILGIVDGFNVCSLGALIIILGLVMVLKSRRRIFLFGGAFLLTTALIYGLLIFLWHQLFIFIAPYIRSMEMLIGLLAIVGGIYLLREFYKAYKNGPICSSNNLMTHLTPKIEKVFKKNTNWLTLLGAIILFAIIVTIVEFPCSAFLPVLFTSILVDAGISLNMSIFYIGLYMLVYLLDEIILFFIAVLTLKIKIVSPKFIVFFNLLAALIFIFLGINYLWGWLS
jgi:glutaredoxin